jgi:RNA polymerase sigma-70 factor (ECF subfamily)
MDDIDYVKAHKTGDRTAFENLVNRYVDRIYSFVLRISGDQSIAEDATQDAFIKAWKGMKSFDESRSFRPWMFSIARNAATDIMRKRKDTPFAFFDSLADDDGVSFSENVADEAPLPEELFERSENKRILESAFEGLDPLDRSIVSLHDSEDMTFEEIASVLGRPMNTVKSRYRRALVKLREMLGGSRAGMHQI